VWSVGSAMSSYPPAWTGYKRSVTIDGAAYEELEYQFCSRHRKLTIHRRHAWDDRSFRRRRFSKTLEHVRAGSVKNLKVNIHGTHADTLLCTEPCRPVQSAR